MFRHVAVHRIIAITLIAPWITAQGFRTLRAAEAPADPDLSTEGMRRLGPLHARPMLIFKDVGYDDNIRFEAQTCFHKHHRSVPGTDRWSYLGSAGILAGKVGSLAQGRH